MAYLGHQAMPQFPGFRVLKRLGKGTYGSVYKVQRLADGQVYAMKVTDLKDPRERQDAVNEVRLLVSVNHINVIRYHEAFVHGTQLCIVMEHAPCGDLKYFIEKGKTLKAPFPEEAIWRIFLQLCRAMAVLHASNIIHRDIKPGNLFLCPHDLLKVGDLGIGKALTHFDFTNKQLGTPVYMAPEIWQSKPYSCNSDLFSMGAVLYEMMTFRVPMMGSSMAELYNKICSGRFTPIAPGRYSSELINVCHQLLSIDPRRRPTAQSILDSPAAAKWMFVLRDTQPRRRSDPGELTGPGGFVHLMDTIKVPGNLRDLAKKLPPPSYDSDLQQMAEVRRAAKARISMPGDIRSAVQEAKVPTQEPRPPPAALRAPSPYARRPSHPGNAVTPLPPLQPAGSALPSPVPSPRVPSVGIMPHLGAPLPAGALPKIPGALASPQDARAPSPAPPLGARRSPSPLPQSRPLSAYKLPARRISYA